MFSTAAEIEPMISVDELRIDYGNLCAVEELSFSVAEGEVFGLIGPNGAGKTSTMRAMVGLLTPTYGAIRIGGFDMREEPQAAGQVLGFMPDFPPVYEDLLVWEFLDLFAASYFIPKPRRSSEIIHRLEQVGLKEKTNSLVGSLSRGMRQRLMLARTLLPEPKVLLLDEPVSGMDPHGRAQMKQVIRDFAKDGGTVLVSSHILSEMDEFCTSIGIMQRGQMIVSGKVDEIAAKVLGQAVIEIEIVSGADLLRKILNDRGIDEASDAAQRKFAIPFDGDDRATSDLLTELVNGGVRVSSFTRKHESLEDVFLQIGAKELS